VIVLDASVLIAHLEVTDAHHQRATEVLLATAGEALGASPITLAEVFVGPARAGQLDRAAAAIEDLQVEAVPLGVDAPARLAALRAETGLRMPDCCVLYAAQTANAALATFDDRLAAAATHHNLTVHTRHR
jgi:predicted nucleic acid-binding protein